MGVLKTVLIVIAVVVSLFWVLGFWAICSYNSKNTPKMDERPQLDKIPTEELLVLLFGVTGELEKRGVVKRMDRNPFEDLE